MQSEDIEALRNRAKREAIDVAVADAAQLLRVVNSPDPADAFRGLILRQIRAISPFVLTGPVPDAMFFGREEELQKIDKALRADRSCVVIGGRRIGKTSILRRLHQVRLKDAGFRSIFFDCSILDEGHTSTARSLLAQPIRRWSPEPPTPAPKTFNELFKSPESDKPLVLLLDEVDKILHADRRSRWSMFKKLRAMTNMGSLRVVFCGEYPLLEAVSDPHSPFFHIGDVLILGPLQIEAVEQLVRGPLTEMEIELANEGIVKAIHEFTSGHPNVVQRFCERLIDKLKERKSRCVTLEDVAAVRTDPHFLKEDFYATYLETASPLECMTTLVMADEPGPLPSDGIRQAIARRAGLTIDAVEVNHALTALVELRHLLCVTSDGYEFAVKAFPKVIGGTLILNQELELCKERYQQAHRKRRRS